MAPVPRGAAAANLVVCGLALALTGFSWLLHDGRLQTLGVWLSIFFGGLALTGTGVVIALRRATTWPEAAFTAGSLFVGLWFLLAVLCQS